MRGQPYTGEQQARKSRNRETCRVPLLPSLPNTASPSKPLKMEHREQVLWGQTKRRGFFIPSADHARHAKIGLQTTFLHHAHRVAATVSAVVEVDLHSALVGCARPFHRERPAPSESGRYRERKGERNDCSPADRFVRVRTRLRVKMCRLSQQRIQSSSDVGNAQAMQLRMCAIVVLLPCCCKYLPLERVQTVGCVAVYM